MRMILARCKNIISLGICGLEEGNSITVLSRMDELIGSIVVRWPLHIDVVQ